MGMDYVVRTIGAWKFHLAAGVDGHGIAEARAASMLWKA